jgi:hypothetical protein
MKSAAILTLLLSIHMSARADFSYTTTRKTTGGAMASMAGTAANGVTKVYFRGQKMKSEDGNTATLIDFGAETVTSINNTAKTYTVRGFNDLTAGQTETNITVGSKETGQRKTINGFDARELILTMQADVAMGRGMGGKMEVEVDMWISSGVPGAGELRAFYQRNADKFPWTAMGGGNQGLQSAMSELQKKIASLDGVTVEQIVRVKPAAGAGGAQMPAMPQMTAAQSAQMDQARARLEAMAAQGGPAAAAAQQALSRMGGAMGGRGPSSASGAGALMELTMDSTDFSTAAIPDSVFAIPADYQKMDAK